MVTDLLGHHVTISSQRKPALVSRRVQSHGGLLLTRRHFQFHGISHVNNAAWCLGTSIAQRSHVNKLDCNEATHQLMHLGILVVHVGSATQQRMAE
jgi:hypothetical protein